MREGSYQCVCGKVQFDLKVPFTSYLVPQTSVLCQCKDCYTFAHALNDARKNNKSIKDDNRANMLIGETNAVHMIQFYKSDLMLVKGDEYLGRLKMFPSSPIVRFYSKCCGTPLLIWADFGGPICVLYSSLIHGKKGAKDPVKMIEPTVVLNHATAQPNSTPTPDGLVVRSWMIDAPRFAFQTLLVSFGGSSHSSGVVQVWLELEVLLEMVSRVFVW
jgi:hypothetical protein